MVTEVRPKYSRYEVSSQHFKLDGYQLYTNVEAVNVGRGVAIYIINHLATRVDPIDLGIDNEESIWLEMKSGKNSKMILGCVYRSPSSSAENDTRLYKALRS